MPAITVKVAMPAMTVMPVTGLHTTGLLNWRLTDLLDWSPTDLLIAPDRIFLLRPFPVILLVGSIDRSFFRPGGSRQERMNLAMQLIRESELISLPERWIPVEWMISLQERPSWQNG